MSHVRQKSNSTARFRLIRAALPAFMLLALATSALLPALVAADHDNYCYAVANPAANVTLLTRITKADFNPATNETAIGNTGTEKTDAIAFQLDTGVLYGSNVLMGSRLEADRRGYIGTYNLSTGQFTQRANPVGYGQGAVGRQNLYDMSGMAFDLETGHLYATHVRTTSGHPDLLFRVDVATGRVVTNAFGINRDYVLMSFLPDYPSLQFVDDIAIDPSDGQMYAVVNNGTIGDRLARVNKLTGTMVDVGPFGIGEVEGMDFDPHGQLWVTAGVTDNSPQYYLYQVNKTTGAASNPRALSKSSNYEALGCMTSPGSVAPSPTSTATQTATATATASPTATATATSLVLPTPDVIDATATPELPDYDNWLYLPLVIVSGGADSGP
jgi:hypothetical protein